MNRPMGHQLILNRLVAMVANLVGYLVAQKSFYEQVKEQFMKTPVKG